MAEHDLGLFNKPEGNALRVAVLLRCRDKWGVLLGLTIQYCEQRSNQLVVEPQAPRAFM